MGQLLVSRTGDAGAPNVHLKGQRAAHAETEGCHPIQTADPWPWKSGAAKKCVTTDQPNGVAPKTDDAGAGPGGSWCTAERRAGGVCAGAECVRRCSGGHRGQACGCLQPRVGADHGKSSAYSSENSEGQSMEEVFQRFAFVFGSVRLPRRNVEASEVRARAGRVRDCGGNPVTPRASRTAVGPPSQRKGQRSSIHCTVAAGENRGCETASKPHTGAATPLRRCLLSRRGPFWKATMNCRPRKAIVLLAPLDSTVPQCWEGALVELREVCVAHPALSPAVVPITASGLQGKHASGFLKNVAKGSRQIGGVPSEEALAPRAAR